jgi:hypothetical protein
LALTSDVARLPYFARISRHFLLARGCPTAALDQPFGAVAAAAIISTSSSVDTEQNI